MYTTAPEPGACSKQSFVVMYAGYAYMLYLVMLNIYLCLGPISLLCSNCADNNVAELGMA